MTEHSIGGARRIGHRRCERLLHSRVDLGAHLAGKRVDVNAELTEPRLLAVDRISRTPLLDLRLRHVLHVVMSRVPVHAHRHGLDQRRPAAVDRASTRGPGRLEHRLGIVPIDADAHDPVRVGAPHRVHSELLVKRGGVRVLIVLEHEHHREPLHARPVQRLVEVATRAGAIAEPGQRASPLASQLERHRHAGRHDHHVGEHRDHPDAAEMPVPEVDVAVAPLRRPARAAQVLREDPGGGDAADHVRGQITVQDAEPVLRCHRERRTGRHRLLAVAVVEGAGDLPLAVEAHRALLQAAHHQHRPQQPGTVRERQMLRGGCAGRPAG